MHPHPAPFLTKEDFMNKDVVAHPSHYNSGRIEVIEIIEDQRLGFHLGNAIKYICRAGKKDPTKEIEDLRKAVWYTNREIERLKAAKENRLPVMPNDMTPLTGATAKAFTTEHDPMTCTVCQYISVNGASTSKPQQPNGATAGSVHHE